MQFKQTAEMAVSTLGEVHAVRELSLDELNTVAGGMVILIDSASDDTSATGIILAE